MFPIFKRAPGFRSTILCQIKHEKKAVALKIQNGMNIKRLKEWVVYGINSLLRITNYMSLFTYEITKLNALSQN